MTALREQIETTRQAYRADRYPGDLAADVRSRLTRQRSWWLGGAALSGLAAAIVLAVLLLPSWQNRLTQLARVVLPGDSFNLDLPGLPNLPPGPQLQEPARSDTVIVRIYHVPVPSIDQIVSGTGQFVTEAGQSIRETGNAVSELIERITT